MPAGSDADGSSGDALLVGAEGRWLRMGGGVGRGDDFTGGGGKAVDGVADSLTNVCREGSTNLGGENPRVDEEGELAKVCQLDGEEGVYLMEPPKTEMMVSRTKRMIKMMRASFIRVLLSFV